MFLGKNKCQKSYISQPIKNQKKKCKQKHDEIPEPGSCRVWAMWTAGQLASTLDPATPGM